MAKSKKNVVTHGLSGKIGGLLMFRQRNGETIVSQIPEPSKKVSAKQLAQRQQFRQAVIYGQSATVVPDTKSIYEKVAAEKKGRTPFTVAVADFLNAPEIRDINLSNYTGLAGDTIKIEAVDDVLVKEVHVRIISSDGTQVEEGLAVSDISGHVWTYTAVQNNDSFDGGKIVVTVSDLPGNLVEELEELTTQ